MKPKQILGSVGFCMYCGATDRNLSEEHIIPLGLGGVWVLRMASCGNCRDITSRIELDVLRNTLLPARANLKLPTRHKGGLPNELPIIVGKRGQQETIQLPVDEHPTVLFLPRFKLPACIDERDYKAGIEVQGMYIYQLGRLSPQDFAKEFNVDNVPIGELSKVTKEVLALPDSLPKSHMDLPWQNLDLE